MPPADLGPLDAAVAALDEYDWVVMTSPNTVAALLSRMTVQGFYPRVPGPARAAAVVDSGSIKPFQLFLIFNELVDAELERVPGFEPAYMLDQSHNVTDPIESLIASAMELTRAYVQAHLVDRARLAEAQEENDALAALMTLKQAYHTDVDPILAMARKRQGGAIDPVAVYRASGYRARVAQARPASARVTSGIV